MLTNTVSWPEKCCEDATRGPDGTIEAIVLHLDNKNQGNNGHIPGNEVFCVLTVDLADLRKFRKKRFIWTNGWPWTVGQLVSVGVPIQTEIPPCSSWSRSKASRLSTRRLAMVLKSGVSRLNSHKTSVFLWHSRSSRRQLRIPYM